VILRYQYTAPNWVITGQYTPPLCSGAPCWRPVVGSRVQVFREGKYYIFSGTSTGRVVVTDVADPQSNLNGTTFFLGAAGSIQAIDYVPASAQNNELLVMGTSIGLVFVYDYTLRRIDSVVLAAASSVQAISTYALYALAVDPVAAVAFYGAGDGYNAFVGRIDLRSQNADNFDVEVLPTTSFQGNEMGYGYIQSVFVDANRNAIYWGTEQPRTINDNTTHYLPAAIFKTAIAECSQYSCGDCGTVDAAYCSYCASTDSCVFSTPGSTRSCPVASPLTRPALCPTVTGISRSVGSTDGGTTVSFTGSNFYTGAGASQYFCQFGSLSPVSATTVSPTSITCTTPASALAGEVDAIVIYGSRPLGSTLKFNYISCDPLGCDTCGAAGDCVWCYRRNQCTGTGGCAGPSASSCPILTSVAPLNISVTTSRTVTLQASAISSGEQYRCNFNGVYRQGTFFSGPSRVQCPSPVGIPDQLMIPTIEIAQDPSNPVAYVPFTQSISPLVKPIDFYNCDGIGACFTCIQNHAECAFCPEIEGILAGGCSYNTSVSQCTAQGLSTCPAITSVTPSLLHFRDDAATFVQIQITAASVDPALYSCLWKAPNGTFFDPIAPQPGATVTRVTCALPPDNPLSLGSYAVEVRLGGVPHSNPFTITVYDCSPGGTCATCMSSSRPKCRWCNALMQCDVPAQISGGCPSTPISVATSCPTIGIDPTSDTIAGGFDLTINSSVSIPTTLPLVCNFRSDGVGLNTDVAGTLVGNNVVCTTPSVVTATLANVTLRVNGINYAAPVSMRFHDCTTTVTGSVRNCSSCLTRNNCGWCGSSCESTILCTAPLTTCPSIVDVSPKIIDGTLPTLVTILTSPSPPSAFNYDCVFGAQRVSAIATGSGIQCLSPFTSSSQPISVSVAITDAGSFIAAGQIPSVEFYRCSQGVSSCGALCSQNPNCGFCADTAQCMGETACKLGSADNLWLFGSTGCPTVAETKPDFMQVAVRNRSVIPEDITFRINNLVLPSPVNVSLAKRSVRLGDFACVFGADIVPVSTYDPTNNTFTCTAPVLYNQGFYSVYLTYKGARLTVDDTRFQLQDCFRIPACGLCLLQPNCGWCRGSVQCMTKAWCDEEPISDWAPVCPGLSGISPSSGLNTGGYNVTIRGGPFVNSPFLLARFARNAVNATIMLLNASFVDDGTLLVVIPEIPEEDVGEFKMAFEINGTLYVQQELAFTYFAPLRNNGTTNIINTGIGSGAIAGIVVGMAAVIAALGIALIVMKRRKVGFFSEFKLKEPDYAAVAYGTTMQPLWRYPKDNWEILAIKLLAKDNGFVFSVMNTTAPTEQDAIARSLTHFYQFHHKSVQYGTLFVTTEVLRNKSENTIFRNDSMASKWFKFYCKIVGVRYIFNELARFIYELNKISEVRAKATETTDSMASQSSKPQLSSSKSLLSLEMEVDPNKYGDSAFTDSEANVYQLILACQKVFTAIRTSLSDIPKEFKIVFQSMREAIMNKFNSEEAILKAVGGFLFLRYICPAITAPHAYGLLPAPPNNVAQRQLVLIGKVIQNLANRTMPGAKETFMLQLNDFFIRNIPKVRLFYDELLVAPTQNLADTQIVEPTEVVKNNALATLMEQIHLQQTKIRKYIKTQEAADDDQRAAALEADLDELLATYKQPKKMLDKDMKKKEASKAKLEADLKETREREKEKEKELEKEREREKEREKAQKKEKDDSKKVKTETVVAGGKAEKEDKKKDKSKKGKDDDIELAPMAAQIVDLNDDDDGVAKKKKK
jgi:hypothetical protein